MKKLIFSLCAIAMVCTFVFAACGEEKTETSTPGGEDWTFDAARSTSPTCGEAGYSYYTNVNGKEKIEVVPATGEHVYGDDYVCDVCGYVDMSDISSQEAIKEYGFYFKDIDGSGTYTTNDLVYFGSYPQGLIVNNSIYETLAETRETLAISPDYGITNDESLYNALSAEAGTLPVAGESKGEDGFYGEGWISYEYYAEGEKSNYMFYKDIEVDGVMYRGVYMLGYRPFFNELEATAANSYASNDTNGGGGNGFELETVYWFRYEPIIWIVLDFSSGRLFLNAKYCIDSQAFQDNYILEDGVYKTQNGTNICEWETSSIREFLNNQFYNLAFTESERAMIPEVTLDNSTTGYHPTSTTDNPYQTSQQDTNDKIFLLSYADMMNSFYGFSDTMQTMKARSRSYSTYALIQGLRPSGLESTADGESATGYCTRSAGSTDDSVTVISKKGIFGYGSHEDNATNNNNGVLPSLYLEIK